MIVGLVCITPGAGYVNGTGAILEAIIDCTIVWMAWTYLQPIVLRKVDDAMGVAYTHGIAGLFGGLLVGFFADPAVVVYHSDNGSAIAAAGVFYGHPKLLLEQFLAAVTIIIWDALVTFIILKVISIFTPLRMPDEDLEIGDLAAHGEEAYPADEGFERIGLGADSAPSPIGGGGI
jgi:Amt family ammonium transporter